MLIGIVQLVVVMLVVDSYACAPSDNAMNGSKDQSFSVAGLVPSFPKHNSISGPLFIKEMHLVSSIDSGRNMCTRYVDAGHRDSNSNSNAQHNPQTRNHSLLLSRLTWRGGNQQPQQSGPGDSAHETWRWIVMQIAGLRRACGAKRGGREPGDK